MADRRGMKRPRGGPNYYDDYRESSRFEKGDKEPRKDVKRDPVLDQDFAKKTEEFIAFDTRFVRSLLGNVKVLMIGDSLMRGLYKDVITWLKSDDLISDRDLKARAEASYRGDRQIDISLLTDDKVFRQAREYQTDNFLIQFLFTTRVMKDDMELLIQQMLGEDGYPDVILINSMIWDLTRYFKVSTDTSYSDSGYQKKIEIEAIEKYLDRTSMLLRRFRAILPPHTMVIWVCFPHCRPSLMGRGMQATPLTSERNHFIRSVMIDGSFRVSQLVRNAGYDVLDVGFYMRNHAFYHYQKDDGMHWLPSGVRLMSQLVMQFLAKSWAIDTTIYFARLEEKQKRDAVKCAITQMNNKYGFYSRDIPKLQDEFAKSAYDNLNTTDKYNMNAVIQKGRTLAPIVQPTIKQIRRATFNSSLTGTSTGFVHEVRLTPRIERRDTVEVDALAMHLLAITKNMESKDLRG